MDKTYPTIQEFERIDKEYSESLMRQSIEYNKSVLEKPILIRGEEIKDREHSQ